MGVFAWFKKMRERRKRWSELPQPALPEERLPIDPYVLSSRTPSPYASTVAAVAEVAYISTTENRSA
jgi:hypothetical protein